MTTSQPTIAQLRLAIDAADEIILRALEARFRAVESIHDLKTEARLPALDPKREEQIRARWKKRAKELNISEPLALLMLDLILTESKNIQAT